MKNFAGRSLAGRKGTENDTKPAKTSGPKSRPAGDGLVTVTFRSPNSFMRPFAQMPRGFCRLATSGDDADYRSR